MSVFDGNGSQTQIRPGISDQVGGIMLSGADIRSKGKKRLGYIGAASDDADHDDRDFGQEGVGVGCGDVHLIASGYGLFVGGDGLVSDISEDRFTAVKLQVVGGTAVTHVGEPVTAGIVRQVAAAGVNNTDHFQTACCCIGQHHGYFLTCYKREILLEQDGTEAGGVAYRYCMEAIGNPVIIGNGAETGVDCVSGSVNGDIDRECIAGGIQEANLAEGLGGIIRFCRHQRRLRIPDTAGPVIIRPVRPFRSVRPVIVRSVRPVIVRSVGSVIVWSVGSVIVRSVWLVVARSVRPVVVRLIGLVIIRLFWPVVVRSVRSIVIWSVRSVGPIRIRTSIVLAQVVRNCRSFSEIRERSRQPCILVGAFLVVHPVILIKSIVVMVIVFCHKIPLGFLLYCMNEREGG